MSYSKEQPCAKTTSFFSSVLNDKIKNYSPRNAQLNPRHDPLDCLQGGDTKSEGLQSQTTTNNSSKAD